MARGLRARQALTRYRFSAVKPRAPENLTIQANTFPMWKLDWINPYSAEDFLSSVLFYLVNISNENDPTDVSGGSATPLATQAGESQAWGGRWEGCRPGAHSKPGDLESQLCPGSVLG